MHKPFARSCNVWPRSLGIVKLSRRSECNELLRSELGDAGDQGDVALRFDSDICLNSLLLVGRNAKAFPSTGRPKLFFSVLRVLDTSYLESDVSLFSGVSFHSRHFYGDALQQASSIPSAEPFSIHIQIVKCITNHTPPHIASVEDAPSLLRGLLQTGGVVSFPILRVYLKVCTSPSLLQMIVDHSVSVSSKPVSTPLFCTLVNGMFTNDMFFRKATFVSMHHTLLGIVSHFTNPLWHQEVPNGQWNAMMRQWSRVYSKLGEGTRLYQSFHHLRTTISGVEDCLPAVFYVNLVGSLMDCNDHSDASGDAWRSITEVSKIGVSLYGHDSRERRTMWVVLLKAALTIYPPSEAASRLLECYQIYAEAGLPLETEKKSFLQITRYMSESITRSTDIGGVQKLIEQYTEFLRKQEWVSFLWILDAVGVMMGDLWNSFGADGSTSAAHLIESVRQLLSSRHVSGVDLQTNPRIAKYMELYSIGDENAFWWKCGCGLTLPSLAVRCVNCLRKEKASWTCVSCGANHVPPCYHQACDACGEANPRRIAAEKVSLQLCAVCGSAHAAGEACTRCGDVAKAKGLSVCCESCQTPLQGDHLYCPNCFTAVNPALCFLWHCDSCQRLNISRRSACHQCGNKRRTQCIVLPFSAWKCGCGASRSPFTRSCSQCSDGPHTYTCPCCLRVSGTTSVFFLEEYKLSVFMCTHCARPHPLDSLILGSPILARHCVQCGRRILHLSERQENLFHCGVHQPINEHVPFFCSSCHHGSAQTGYHCKDCLSPREELLSSEDTFVWRCVQEGSDSDSVCGSWNYSWQNQCRACKRGRIYTKFECRAKLSTWRCTQCAHKNNPLHVLNCEACGAFRRATVCEVCGIQHLTVDCITAV